MKKFHTTIAIIFIFFTIVYPVHDTFAQTALIIDENFSYSAGTLTNVSPIWSESPTSGSPGIKVKDGNLSYANYPSSNIGKEIGLNGGGTRPGALIPYPAISGNGSKLYASFLIIVTSTIDLDTSTSSGTYFAAFRDTASSTVRRAFVYLRQGSTSSKFSIGLAKSSNHSLSWYSSELDVGTTYLIVTSYLFQSGTGDDVVKMWVNPSLAGPEPPADISFTNGTDANSLGGYQFLQKTSSGDEDIDGLRVATSWSQAPLPVELTSFTATSTNSLTWGSEVVLNWQTATEVNNYGFEVERARLRPKERDYAEASWETLGFVNGNGNSNSPKSYSFTDNSAISGKYSYRLKQIDVDGKFEYSDVAEVTIGAPGKFELLQNYPNPFNPTTQISFALPLAAKVNLSVFNMLGQKVEELANHTFEAGVHAVQFNAASYSSGIYFYKLTTGNFLQIKKMMLLK